MSNVSKVINELVCRIEMLTGIRPIVYNTYPAVMDENAIYILSPQEDEITIRPMISSDSWHEFKIEVFKVTHVSNMNRAKDVKENIVQSLEENDSFRKIVVPRFGLLHNIAGSVITEMNYGTSTWVTDTKVFSAYKMTLMFSDVLED